MSLRCGRQRGGAQWCATLFDEDLALRVDVYCFVLLLLSCRLLFPLPFHVLSMLIFYVMLRLPLVPVIIVPFFVAQLNSTPFPKHPKTINNKDSLNS